MPSGILHHGPPSISSAPKIRFRHLVTPIAKRALGELHDVALVHQGHALALVLDRVADRAVNQAHAAGIADRLDPDAHPHIGREIFRADLLPEFLRLRFRAEANFRERLRKFLLEKIEHLLRFRCARSPLDAGVNVLRVFAEDHHVHLLRVFHGRGHTLEILHRPQTNEEIEHLPQRDIQRADPAADRRRQGTLDPDQIFAKRRHRVVRQPVIEFVFRRLTGEDLEPRNLSLPAVSLFDRGIHHPHARRPDIGPGAVAANKRNHRMIRHVQFFGSGNLVAGGRSEVFVRHGRNCRGRRLSRQICERRGSHALPRIADQGKRVFRVPRSVTLRLRAVPRSVKSA